MATFLDRRIGHTNKYTRIRFVAAILLLNISLLLAATGGALILERADSNDNIYEAAIGEFISYLRGNVVFLYEDIRISSDSATWQRSAGVVDFGGNIRVEQNGQVMTCSRLHLVRDNNLLTASGNVLYRDSAGVTFISGEIAEYMTDKSEALLRGSPLLTRVDSASADTLFISGVTIRYNDSLKIATITDSVSIRRGDLNAVCEKGEYFINTGTAFLRINPVIYYESHRIVGDSVDLFFGGESLDSAIVMGNAHGRYTEIADTSADTTVTHIWSDTLYLRMFEDGQVNSMKAFGNARGNYTEISASSGNRVTTNIASDSLYMFMFETGKVKSMKAFGNARGSYTETSAPSGNTLTTDITSDSLYMFMFETGKVKSMKASGNTRGAYSETGVSQGRERTMVTNISSDSLHVFMFEAGKISAMKAFGRAHGRNAEWSAPIAAEVSAPDTLAPSVSVYTPIPDSTITHIWSDSLHVLMSEGGKINAMNAFGNVISKHFIGDSVRVNEVSGMVMMLAFGENGRIEEAVVKGNAKSIYFIDESDGGGTNKANGDEIRITFAEGKAHRLRIRGNVKGMYFP